MTTKSEIRSWLEEGMHINASHVIVVTDTFDYDDYPVYVEEGQDVNAVADGYRSMDMQRVTEVYSLTGKHSIEKQLNEDRAFHYD